MKYLTPDEVDADTHIHYDCNGYRVVTEEEWRKALPTQRYVDTYKDNTVLLIREDKEQ